MKNFWLSHSQEPNVTKMLLDSDATNISKEELPEVLSLLPEIRGKEVLELAGGIGRFTGIIAQQASHVTTVDFIGPFIEENKRNNKNYTNIDYVIDDVMNLKFKNESFDLIFSNWLLIYFSDDDLYKLVGRLLMWLKDGGFFFFRESCGENSGNMRDRYNPALYRLPHCYSKYFESVSEKIDGQTRWGFSLRFTRNLQSYIKAFNVWLRARHNHERGSVDKVTLKGNLDSICWLMQKKRSKDDFHNCDYKQFLKSKENSKKNVLRYEKIFGKGFINIGGLQMVQIFTNKLQHYPGQKILDVGCGIGGADFYMTEKYGAEVLGVDESSMHINIAWERKYKNHKDAHVCFEIGDITEREYPANFFDVIISLGAMGHIRDKKQQMRSFFDWLKGEGRIIISDFCCGRRPDEKHSTDSQGNCCELYTIKAYTALIEDAGFVEVKSEDRSEQMIAFMNSARMKITQNMQEFFVDFTEDDLTEQVTTWDNELKRYEAKDLIWCLFSARKPTTSQC